MGIFVCVFPASSSPSFGCRTCALAHSWMLLPAGAFLGKKKELRAIVSEARKSTARNILGVIA